MWKGWWNKEGKTVLRKILKTIDEDVAKYSIEAEEKADLVLLTEANSFWKTKIEKENAIKALDNALQKLDKDLKSLDN